MAIIAVGATANYVIYVEFASFEGKALIPYHHLKPGAVIAFISAKFQILFQMVYLTVQVVTTLGFGDIIPTHLGGQASVLLIQVQAFILLTVVLNILFNELVKATGPPTDDQPRASC
jgi:hypothetical protein